MNILRNSHFLESDEFPFHAEHYLIGPKEVIPPHSHEFIELVYVIEGRGLHQYKDEKFVIREGDVFVIEPNVSHAYEVNDDAHLLVCNILFLPSLLNKELKALSRVTSFLDFFFVEPFLRNRLNFSAHLKVNGYDQLEMKNLINRLLFEYNEKRLGYRIMTITHMIELFVFLSRCYENQSPLKNFISDDHLITYISEFVRKHFDKELSLEQVSQMCGMSKTTFSIKFKEQTGKTFIEFRNSIRIEEAIFLLKNTSEAIQTISNEVGFKDLSFFNKIFKKITGTTPRDFRVKFKNESAHMYKK